MFIEGSKNGTSISGSSCTGVAGTGTFFGTVFESDGFTVVPSASIYFCRAGSCYTTIADLSGAYSTLPQISSGVYTIRAAKVGIGFISAPNNTMVEPATINVDLTFNSTYQNPVCP